MNKKDPLTIQIPAGATEINLRPILVPIIQALLTKRHWSPYDAVRDKEAEEWLSRAFEHAAWWARATDLRLDWIERYLRDHDWKQYDLYDKEKLRFEKPKKSPHASDSDWERRHHVDLRSDHHESDKFRAMLQIVITIMQADGFGGPNETIDAIIEHAGLLDRLANEGEKDVRVS